MFGNRNAIKEARPIWLERGPTPERPFKPRPDSPDESNKPLLLPPKAAGEC